MLEEEKASKDLQEILDLFVSAGYDDNNVSSLSPPEKVMTGLAWCIDATHIADADFRYKVSLHDKVQVGEDVEAALSSMECPFPLQAHQIEALDYRALYPVVEWVVNFVRTMQAETVDEENVTSLKRLAIDQEKSDSDQERKDKMHMPQHNILHQTTNTSIEEHVGVDRCFIQHSVDVPDTTSMPDLPDKLNPLTLEDESLLPQKVASILRETKEGEIDVQQLEIELRRIENSIKMLLSDLSELDQKKVGLLNDIEQLHQRISKSNYSDTLQKLISLSEVLKALERQGSDYRSLCKQKCADRQAEMLELEKKISAMNERKSDSLDLDSAVSESLEKLNSAKRELATKLREIVSLKRKFDDVPSQSELIQYERRFSELYVQIQDKLQQTRKHYATYNALLERKELMLKETSLLSSISSQFQDAMTSTTGRSKLINSMEVIVKGTQQKLEKVQLSFFAEQKICDSLKEKYAKAIAEQRNFSFLLKVFQEECVKNERLQSLTSI